jgi:indolepyruvate ferredoxin oxidoreductase, alpha subunit
MNPANNACSRATRPPPAEPSKPGCASRASYPGSPSVQILECLAKAARDRNMYAEWSINEKVALEVAAAASFAGLRALSIMKADGLNVAHGFSHHPALSGILGRSGPDRLGRSRRPLQCQGGGQPLSGAAGPRAAARAFGSPEDTRDMLVWAFEISEKTDCPSCCAWSRVFAMPAGMCA